MIILLVVFLSCFQSVKDIKFESNSQRTFIEVPGITSCFQSVKDIKFESNSQQENSGPYWNTAVSSLSKI